MKIVFDTNVIIAAFATRGLCKSIFEFCLYKHEIIISAHILGEVKRVLSKKLKMPVTITGQIAAFLEESSTMEAARKLGKKVCRDPDDDKILGLAVQADADMIITGDKDLLVHKEYESIPIKSPRDFWSDLQKK